MKKNIIYLRLKHNDGFDLLICTILFGESVSEYKLGCILSKSSNFILDKKEKKVESNEKRLEGGNLWKRILFEESNLLTLLVSSLPQAASLVFV